MELYMELFSLPEIILFSEFLKKLEGLRGDTETRGIYISCLSPNHVMCYDKKGNYITPIFNLLMKEMYSDLSKNLEIKTKQKSLVEFWGAEDICREMGVPVEIRNFYTMLPWFIAGTYINCLSFKIFL